MNRSDTIIFTVTDGVAAIRLNRPEVFNSFNTEMALALQHYLDLCKTDTAIRAVLITGVGKGFCAGQDLAEASNVDSREIPGIVQKNYNPIVLKLRQLHKPVIAAVNGIAAGAGVSIALACDIVVATMSASFVQAFSKIGLIPDSGGTYFLPRLIGMQRATALMLTGDKVSAPEAQAMGLIYKVFEDAVFEKEVDMLVHKLAAMPTKGLGYTKELLNTSFGSSLEEQLNQEAIYQQRAAETDDFKEGVAAFIQKRKPDFKGH